MFAMNWDSIRKKALQIKYYVENKEEVVFVIVFILVTFIAFGLGRLSATAELREPLRILQAKPANVLGSPYVIGGKVVASRSGSKYHAPWCSGASRIKEHNQIWFKDEQAARKAGYTPAKNCKGLK